MKTFFSIDKSPILSLILSCLLLFILFFSLFSPFCPNASLYNSFGQTVFAKEVTNTTGHTTLSTAFVLSRNTLYTDHLATNASSFYYSAAANLSHYEIKCHNTSQIKISFFSSTGNTLSFEKKIQGSTIKCIPKDISKKTDSSYFFKLQNRTAQKISFTIKAVFSIQRSDSSKPKKAKITIYPKVTPQKVHSSKKRDKLSTKRRQIVNLNPHFILMRENNVHKLSIISNHKKTSLMHFTYIITDPQIIQIENENIIAKNKGTTILYLKSKKNLATTSCIIRVY